MIRTRLMVKTLARGLSVLGLIGGAAQAAELWGHVESVDTRFRKITIRHEGVYDHAQMRIGPDTEFRFPDGRVLKRVALDSLVGKPIYATVEETTGHYAMKVWILRGEPAGLLPGGAGPAPGIPRK